MKSFDEMADDFVTEQTELALPYDLTKHQQRFLRLGYMWGLNAGIEFCADTVEPMAKEEKGL